MKRNFAYPIRLEAEQDGSLVVSFPDLPEALTEGADLADALAQGSDCLSEALAGRISDNEEIPEPSWPDRGGYVVEPEPLVAAKAALYLAWKESGLTKVELAARIGVPESRVRQRILNPRHNSKIETIQAALRALDHSLSIGVLPRKVA